MYKRRSFSGEGTHRVECSPYLANISRQVYKKARCGSTETNPMCYLPLSSSRSFNDIPPLIYHYHGVHLKSWKSNLKLIPVNSICRKEGWN